MRSSSCDVVYQFGHLHVRLSSSEVVFLLGGLPLRSISAFQKLNPDLLFYFPRVQQAMLRVQQAMVQYIKNKAKLSPAELELVLSLAI